MIGKFALILSPNGIDNIIFLPTDRKESMGFYLLIEDEIKKFEANITILAQKRLGEKENGIHQ